ncbi:hypothetical protein [Sporosarcina sp. P33]|uniref:GerMN domain-containing protein n=1 Tax=Sporosarcina sp. P33 TaxID=1930764 RepID=UPI0009BE73E8|nr:hypothetical protein [Sporosarcina sp. P33]ARD49427.1 hypothetical protein SporoP33_14990 [Sporosarcina sp. P33]
MSADKWNEDEIKKRLHNMPVVEDQRTKDEILHRLKNDSRLAENKEPEKKRSAFNWPPIIAAAAAILLLTILVPVFLQQNTEVSMDKAVTEDSGETNQMESAEETESSESADVSMYTKMGPAPHYAVYPADTASHTAFHIGLITDQATVVPVTFLIPDEQVRQDIGVSPTAVALYNAYASKIDEESLGFSDYHPYDAAVSSDGLRMTMKFAKGHSYDVSSAALEMLNLSVQDTFYGFEEVEFLQEDGSPITFDQVGEIKEPIKLTGALSRQAYYLFVKSDGEAVLSSDFGKSFHTVTEALNEMKTTPNDIYATVIPEGVDFSVLEESGRVKVQFTETLDLEKYQPEEAMQLIEGILLTAASFDKRVEFDQIVQKQWNGFDFTQPLEKPVGANPKSLIIE